jgi:hypothetical protein
MYIVTFLLTLRSTESIDVADVNAVCAADAPYRMHLRLCVRAMVRRVAPTHVEYKILCDITSVSFAW